MNPRSRDYGNRLLPVGFGTPSKLRHFTHRQGEYATVVQDAFPALKWGFCMQSMQRNGCGQRLVFYGEGAGRRLSFPWRRQRTALTAAKGGKAGPFLA